MRRAAVILAGGSGTRLWPLSRTARPKQLLKILEGRSLLREAYDRLRSFMAAENIHVIALSAHLPAIADELPQLPPGNLIGEPMGRDTANAIALSAAVLHRDDPETVMGVFTADHHIVPVEHFAADVQCAFEVNAAHPDSLVTFGIRPTSAHTGFGYLECGPPAGAGACRVISFREKPNAETAATYLTSGRHYWNSGMFVWRTETILNELERRLPETHAAVTRIAAVQQQPERAALAAAIYPTLPRTSIDFAVMEKADEVLMVEAHFQWHDLGNWTALAEILPRDSEGNVVAARQASLMDCRDLVVVSESDHLIAAIGADDLVIVHSPDATLICRRDRIQDIRELVARLEQEPGGRHT